MGDWYGNGPALRLFFVVVFVAAVIGTIGGFRNGCYLNDERPVVAP
jgi:hypothetical protein